jgi:hypothetical protein
MPNERLLENLAVACLVLSIGIVVLLAYGIKLENENKHPKI